MFRNTDNFLIVLLFAFLLLGQWGRIDLAPGITLYLADLAVALLAIRVIAVSGFTWPASLSTQGRDIALVGGTFFLSLAFNFWRLTLFQTLQSGLYLVRFLAYLWLFFAASRLSSSRFWLRSLAAFGTAVAFLGLIQLVLLPDMRQLSYLGFDPHYFRLVSTFFDPNFTALILSLTVLLLIHLKSGIEGHLWMAAVAVNLTALLLTYSRGGYLSLLSGLAVYSIMRNRYVFLAAAMVILGLFSLIPKLNYESLDLWRVATIWARWENLQEGLGWFAKAPLFGWGFNTLRFTVNEPRALETVVVSRALSGFDNSFVFILVTTGFAGFMAYACLWLNGLKPVFKKAGKPFALLLIPSLAAILVHAQINNSLFFPAVMVFAFTLLGLSKRQENW